MDQWRVPLPPGVRGRFTVYVNGVRQQPGTDYDVADGVLLFRRELVKEGRVSGWRWLIGAFGVGTYRRDDVVDVAHAGGLAHALDIEPPPRR